jgi:hypothetical protein
LIAVKIAVPDTSVPLDTHLSPVDDEKYEGRVIVHVPPEMLPIVVPAKSEVMLELAEHVPPIHTSALIPEVGCTTDPVRIGAGKD